MGLVRDGELVSDDYLDLSDREPEALPAEGALLLSLPQWEAHRSELAGRRIGVRLQSDQHPRGLADDLAGISLVALEFPRFRDGRAYSYARLLRERYGFGGELRAVGDVLLEQLHYMQRCGFNAFELASADPLGDFRVAANQHSVWYQATGDGRAPAHERRHRPSS